MTELRIIGESPDFLKQFKTQKKEQVEKQPVEDDAPVIVNLEDVSPASTDHPKETTYHFKEIDERKETTDKLKDSLHLKSSGKQKIAGIGKAQKKKATTGKIQTKKTNKNLLSFD